MITKINVYFEYIKISCKIITKYIVPILQVYPNHLIILLKLLQMTFIIIFINIILHDDDDDDDDITR
jgi:hypothetical protein